MLLSKNKKLLVQILSDGKFHSGTVLAKKLGISRSAICKLINGLLLFGVDVQAVNGKGYRLKKSLELLDKEYIVSNLDPAIKCLITDFIVHDQMTSTNSYLLEKAYKDVTKNGVVCIAEQQIQGRGRRGRQWISPYGDNIYISLLYKFEEGTISLSGLSLAVGVAVINALIRHNITGVGLKWPNDIYWQQRKLGGILVEISGEHNGPCHAVIGLGLNLFLPKNEAKKINQDWVDLTEILKNSNQTVTRNALLVTIIEELLKIVSHYKEEPSFERYKDKWREYDCMVGKFTYLFIGNKKIAGEVMGINDHGLLLLKTEEGNIKSYASGEVSFSDGDI